MVKTASTIRANPYGNGISGMYDIYLHTSISVNALKIIQAHEGLGNKVFEYEKKIWKKENQGRDLLNTYKWNRKKNYTLYT